jgi:two-component system sensor histidine kinase/response regulator
MSNSLIDADTLTRLNDLGGSDLIVKMVELFSEHAPKRLQAASEGLEKGDCNAIERAVHSLKSSAANLGATSLQNLASQIEALALQNDIAAIAPLISELQTLFDAVLNELQTVKDQYSA